MMTVMYIEYNLIKYQHFRLLAYVVNVSLNQVLIYTATLSEQSKWTIYSVVKSIITVYSKKNFLIVILG